MTWEDLSYWSSADWRIVQERLDEMDRKGLLYNPRRDKLFASLDAVPFEQVRVVIMGQDPYPERNYATGIAFSIPKRCTTIPPSLKIILQEYCDDLHTSWPRDVTLGKWTEQGCLLQNAIPSCKTNASLSHDWPEWQSLTKEIVEKLS